MTVQELINKLEKWQNKDAQICAPLWVADDVTGVAEDKGIELTDEQVEEIMYQMERKHDAEIGINWDVIDATIDWVVNK